MQPACTHVFTPLCRDAVSRITSSLKRYHILGVQERLSERQRQHLHMCKVYIQHDSPVHIRLLLWIEL